MNNSRNGKQNIKNTIPGFFVFIVLGSIQFFQRNNYSLKLKSNGNHTILSQSRHRNLYLYINPELFLLRLSGPSLVCGAQWFERTYIIFVAEGVNMMSQSHLLARFLAWSETGKPPRPDMSLCIYDSQNPDCRITQT